MRVAAAFLALLVGLAAALGSAAPAVAEERIALVIGNQGYAPAVGRLTNPHNDITLVSDALKKIGFQVMPPVKDAKRRQILSAVQAFAQTLKTAGSDSVGFLYYSGHGVAHPQTRANYLIPVDVEDTRHADFWFDAVPLDDVLAMLRSHAPDSAHFVIFDACRNELVLPQKTTAKGFVPVAERQGMYIAFATAPNAIASDAGKGGGPYALALAAQLVQPGQDHLQLFQNVKEAVFASTSQVQVPWESNGLLRRVYLAGKADLTGSADAHAERIWQVIKGSPSVAILETFIKEYPGTKYAQLALKQIETLSPGRSQLGYAEVPVRFATDRAAASGSERITFSGQQTSRLSLGKAVVTIPLAARAVQSISRPSSWTIPAIGTITLEKEDPSRHFTIASVNVAGERAMATDIREQIAKVASPDGEALVYVHGFNTTFDDALYRSAQLAYDIAFAGPVFLYSWASEAGLQSYLKDKENARLSSRNFQRFLTTVRTRTGLKRINIMAHGLGAGTVIEALDGIRRDEQKQAAEALKRDRGTKGPDDAGAGAATPAAGIGELILVSPDVDREVFRHLVEATRDMARGITVFVSSSDLTLKAARTVSRGESRAGDVDASGALVLPGVDTIDVTGLTQDFFSLGHSAYSDKALLFSDIAKLLKTGMRPPDARSDAWAKVQSASGTYWRYAAR